MKDREFLFFDELNSRLTYPLNVVLVHKTHYGLRHKLNTNYSLLFDDVEILHFSYVRQYQFRKLFKLRDLMYSSTSVYPIFEVENVGVEIEYISKVMNKQFTLSEEKFTEVAYIECVNCFLSHGLEKVNSYIHLFNSKFESCSV